MNTAAFIEKIVKEKASEPMSLFLSYAHRESIICRLIVLTLKARGHKVWFDELNIPHGSDWRREIVKGIEESSGVLSMLSNEAVRPGGVCLDELSIAVGVRGGNIRTVLLEKDVTPPPTVIERQWLDLTEWQEFRRQKNEDELLNSPVFTSWFAEKANLLIRMLETKENREFEGQLTTIRSALPRLFTAVSRQSFLLKESYVERTWIRDQIDRWLDDPEGKKLLVIYGDPGIGKSAFAAHYAHYNGRVAAAVFCERGQDTLNSPESVIETIAYKLACRLPDYREYISIKLSNNSPLSSLNADELFEVLLASPLSTLISAGRATECILVDGVDETGTGDKNVLASVLSKYADRFPEWLRILVLSRRVPAVRRWFAGADYIDLDRMSEENLADIRAFVSEGLKELTETPEAAAEKTEMITSRCDGVFLYARMILSALKEGKASIDEADQFPHGLNGIFLQWFQWYFPDSEEYDNKVRPALNLMAASQEPIPEEEITEITGWRRKQTEEFMRLMNVHLRVDTDGSGKKVVDVNHLFIREWLLSSEAGEYQVFAEDGVMEMAEFFAELLAEKDPEFTEYEALYIPHIMNQAAEQKRSMRRAYSEAMTNEYLMKRQEALGKEYSQRNQYVLAIRYLKLALEIAGKRCEEEDTAENRKHLVICKNRLSQALSAVGNTEEASSMNEEALKTALLNLHERGAVEDMRRAAVSMMVIADTAAGTERALSLYKDARDLLEQASGQAEADDEDVFRNLAISYNRLGEIYMRSGDAVSAVSSFRKDLQITYRFAMSTGKREARRDLAVSYNKLAAVYNMCGVSAKAREYYGLALRTMEYLAADNPLPDDLRGLAVLLNSKGIYTADPEEAEEDVCRNLMEGYERSLSISRQLAQNYGLVRDHLNEAASYANIGNVYYRKHDKKNAVNMWKEAYTVYRKYSASEAEILLKMIEECEV